VVAGCDRLGRVRTSLALRAASAADAGTLLELITATELAEIGECDVALGDIEDEFAIPTFRAWLQGDDPGRAEAGLWLAGSPARTA
jgi:hypothetical protein